MIEKKLQTEIIQWLKANNVYVIKTKPGGGTPVGCVDVIGLYHDRWCAIEVKADEKSKDQPLQRLTQKRLGEYNRWVYRVYPENWPEVKLELQNTFF